MAEKVDEKIRELFATILRVPPEEIGDETDPATVARWDSMQHLILVAGFEEEFGIEVEPEETADMYAGFAAFKQIILQKLPAAE